jgi:hypothetical protein
MIPASARAAMAPAAQRQRAKTTARENVAKRRATNRAFLHETKSEETDFHFQEHDLRAARSAHHEHHRLSASSRIHLHHCLRHDDPRPITQLHDSRALQAGRGRNRGTRVSVSGASGLPAVQRTTHAISRAARTTLTRSRPRTQTGEIPVDDADYQEAKRQKSAEE